jgi:hypothetical protein
LTAFAATISIIMIGMAACSPGSGGASVDRPARPVVPAGWTITRSASDELRLALPPDIVVFERSGVILANEFRPDGTLGIQIHAEGPRGAEIQPSPGDDLARWIETKWLPAKLPRSGTSWRTVVTSIGPLVELRSRLGPGTVDERALVAYAVPTASGVGFIAIDGPPGEMADRADEIALIVALIEMGPMLAADPDAEAAPAPS